MDGVPRLGWEDTLAYLTIPVILVATQTLSLQLLGSFDAIDESKDDQKNVANALRFLPLMIGWFALNAPSGLGLYWVFNNVLTTLSTVTVKKLVEQAERAIESLMQFDVLDAAIYSRYLSDESGELRDSDWIATCWAGDDSLPLEAGPQNAFAPSHRHRPGTTRLKGSG